MLMISMMMLKIQFVIIEKKSQNCKDSPGNNENNSCHFSQSQGGFSVMNNLYSDKRFSFNTLSDG
jgi:hypothetical protein